MRQSFGVGQFIGAKIDGLLRAHKRGAVRTSKRRLSLNLMIVSFVSWGDGLEGKV
jgi:hypothetical protein